MRILQLVCIVIIIFTINSCSLVQSVYNNAPEVMSWWLDEYFDFTKAQKALLSPALHQVHEWHRNEQLPEYIAILQGLKYSASRDSITASEACEHIEKMKTSFSTLQLAFIPTILELAPLISDKQLAYLKQKLAKRADKWKSEWWQATPAAQLEARLEKTEEYVEKVYGSVNAAQLALIKQKLQETPTQPAIVYAEILRRNEDIVQIIIALRENALNEEQKTALIKAGFTRLQESPNKAYQQHANQINQRTCDIIADVHNLSDAKQKKHASDWFWQFEQQLKGLSNPQ